MTGASGPADAIEAAVEDLQLVAGEIAGRGHAMARTYLAAALVSLRFARAALVAAERDHAPPAARPGLRRVVFADGLPTPVFLASDGGLADRGRLVDGRFLKDGMLDCELPGMRAVDLGADLLASGAAAAMAAGPVGASLLADALGTRHWKHPLSPHLWSAGRFGGRAIVSALAGGAAVRPLCRELSGVVLDRSVLSLVESLGWRRHVGEIDGADERPA